MTALSSFHMVSVQMCQVRRRLSRPRLRPFVDCRASSGMELVATSPLRRYPHPSPGRLFRLKVIYRASNREQHTHGAALSILEPLIPMVAMRWEGRGFRLPRRPRLHRLRRALDVDVRCGLARVLTAKSLVQTVGACNQPRRRLR